MPINKEAKAAYDREYRAKNRERIAAAKKANSEANPGRQAAASRAWDANNKERSLAIKKAHRDRSYVAHPLVLTPTSELKARAISRAALWREANPDKYAAQLTKATLKPKKPRTPEQKARHASHQSLRCRKLLCAQPPWADKEAINAIYLEAQTKGMHVDHVIPLQGKLVSGLHVAGNLQLLTPRANLRKRNKFIQEAEHAH